MSSLSRIGSLIIYAGTFQSVILRKFRPVLTVAPIVRSKAVGMFGELRFVMRFQEGAYDFLKQLV